MFCSKKKVYIEKKAQIKESQTELNQASSASSAAAAAALKLKRSITFVFLIGFYSKDFFYILLD